MKYRIKKVVYNGVEKYYAQKKVFWWWENLVAANLWQYAHPSREEALKIIERDKEEIVTEYEYID